MLKETHIGCCRIILTVIVSIGTDRPGALLRFVQKYIIDDGHGVNVCNNKTTSGLKGIDDQKQCFCIYSFLGIPKDFTRNAEVVRQFLCQLKNIVS